MKRIAVFGSTGSIGEQALEAAALYPERFRITALCAGRNKEKLFEQARRFRPDTAGLAQPLKLSDIPEDLRGIQWQSGPGMLQAIANNAPYDTMLAAIVGIAGLESVLCALQNGKQVLLANKEALVAGGSLVTRAAQRANSPLLPVDSEHSAIFQCLQGAGANAPVKVLLTASGGPFRAFSLEQLKNVTPEQALRHPNWRMGKKITIDSATMFNKALEMIEAKWLFSLHPEQIEILIHKESLMHSAVVFQDGAIIAQIGLADMRLPILYAMAYPDRLDAGVPAAQLSQLSPLTFEPCDPIRFPALRLGYECLTEGGAAACIMNGANEEAVTAFLEGRLPFTGIAQTVERTLNALGYFPDETLSDILNADQRARVKARELIQGGIP